MRKIPIVAVLHGITATELQSRADVPVLLKRRNFLDINELERYFEQLRGRVITGVTGNEGVKP